MFTVTVGFRTWSTQKPMQLRMSQQGRDVTVSVCLLFGVGVDRWKLDRWTVTRGCRADGRQKAESETAGGMESCMGSRWMD